MIKFIGLGLGLIMMVVGFFHDEVENIPNVLKYFAPQYVEGSQALNKLEGNISNEKSEIRPVDIGFNVLANLYYQKRFRVLGVSGSNKSWVIEFKGEYGNVDAGLAGQGHLLLVKLSDDSEGSFLSSDVLAALVELKQKELFWWARLFFIVGFFMTLFTGLCDRRGKCNAQDCFLERCNLR